MDKYISIYIHNYLFIGCMSYNTVIAKWPILEFYFTLDLVFTQNNIKF